MGQFSGLFKKVAEATHSESGAYVEPGVYLVEINKLKVNKSFVGVDAFIAEFDILRSNNDTRPVGTQMTWYCGFDKPNTAANIKDFFGALFPVEYAEILSLEKAVKKNPDDTDSEMRLKAANDAFRPGMEIAVGDDNPANGARLHIEARQIPTKSGGVYTKCRFRLLTDEENASLDEAA